MYTRISGYGQTGPKATLPGYASVCEGFGGFRCAMLALQCWNELRTVGLILCALHVTTEREAELIPFLNVQALEWIPRSAACEA